MVHVNAIVERTKSRSGKHASYAGVFVVYPDGRVEEPKVVSRKPVRGTYARGQAASVILRPPKEGAVLVLVHMNRNLRGRVRGVMRVVDPEAREVLRVVYRKLKIRRSRGDSRFEWAVRAVADHLKLPVKRYNMSTGGSRAPAV